MNFLEIVDQVVALLRQRGRLSYRAIRRQFELDDAQIEDVKFELVDIQAVAVDQDGIMLVVAAPPPEPAHEVAAPVEDLAPAAAPLPRDEAERRQLSVLFCDLVDSTPLAAALDPEELREVLHEYQTVCAGAIERYGGLVVRQVGDGLLVDFGYPQAHEDDAARAVRAGLAILSALPELNAAVARRWRTMQSHPLRVRMGLHTGLVVIGTLGDSTYRDPMALVGETPNIAARVQGLAAPDTIIVSSATHRLLGDAFVCEDMGPHTLKGVAAPVHVYRVLREREVETAPERSTPRRVTPMVGRDQELGVLLDRWEQSKEGHGQLVMLSGEAGIGKSRLIQALKAEVADEPHIRLEGRSSTYHQQSAFHPMIELLQRALQLQKEDAPAVKLEKLTAAIGQYLPSAVAIISPLAQLLGFAEELADGGPGLTPQQQRQQTLKALLEVVLQPAARQPVLMILEDLQWADPSTLEMLQLLMEQAGTASILLVLTARPGFRFPGGLRAQLTMLTLGRLRRSHVAQLAAAVTGGKALPAEILEQIAVKTDGVPLFVEELTKMVLESGLVREAESGYELVGPLTPLAIPTTLQDSLMARLDRLAATKIVVQLGATLGRSFPYELLRAVAGLDEGTLAVELAKLVDAELLHQHGLPPSATYSFKHALIQDAAYQALLRSTRQHYHQRIAQVIEEQFPDVVETQPEFVAQHFTEAGLAAQAVRYWQRAGERAVRRSANVEAIAHLTRGVELIETIPASFERQEWELDLLTALGPALLIAKGQGAPEVEQIYGRARELCGQIGETPRLFPVLWGLWYFYLGRADYAAAREMGQQLLVTGERAGDAALLLLAHRVLGQVVFFQGEFAEAWSHLEQATRLYDASAHRGLTAQYAQDPGVAAHSYGSLALWVLGQSDRAAEHERAALVLARETAHPYTLAFALSGAVWLHQFRGEPDEVQKHVDELIALATEHGYAYLRARGIILRGWMLAAVGRDDEGIADMSAGIAELQAKGAEIWRPHWLTLLAEAYGRVGQVAEGLRILDEAIVEAEQTGELWWAAESHRVKGELLLSPAWGAGDTRAGDRSRDGRAEVDAARPDAAEASLLGALQIARGQRAKALELRAAVSLARLWTTQGKQPDAQRLLAEVDGSLTEGLDTKDAREARALLDALA